MKPERFTNSKIKFKIMSITKTEKKFDAVKMAREIKDKLDAKLSKMTKEEIVAYFKEQRTKVNRVRPSA